MRKEQQDHQKRDTANPEQAQGIWEIKDGKLYRGYQVSQPVTDKDDTSESYHKVKI